MCRSILRVQSSSNSYLSFCCFETIHRQQPTYIYASPRAGPMATKATISGPICRKHDGGTVGTLGALLTKSNGKWRFSTLKIFRNCTFSARARASSSRTCSWPSKASAARHVRLAWHSRMHSWSDICSRSCHWSIRLCLCALTSNLEAFSEPMVTHLSSHWRSSDMPIFIWRTWTACWATIRITNSFLHGRTTWYTPVLLCFVRILLLWCFGTWVSTITSFPHEIIALTLTHTLTLLVTLTLTPILNLNPDYSLLVSNEGSRSKMTSFHSCLPYLCIV